MQSKQCQTVGPLRYSRAKLLRERGPKPCEIKGKLTIEVGHRLKSRYELEQKFHEELQMRAQRVTREIAAIRSAETCREERDSKQRKFNGAIYNSDNNPISNTTNASMVSTQRSGRIHYKKYKQGYTIWNILFMAPIIKMIVNLNLL